MTISISEEGQDVLIDISGVIKNASDSQSIKDALDSIVDENINVTFNIYDSFILTSALIGYIRIKIHEKRFQVQMNVGNPRLYEMLEMYGLIDIFRVVKR